MSKIKNIALIAFILPLLTGCGDNISSLNAADFTVSDGTNTVILDSDFSEFIPPIPEKQSENNYVGEEYSGDFVYKVFRHGYPDYALYVSNTNYNMKNRSFDEYYITQITFNNSNYQTARGIYIGSDADDVIKAYGNNGKHTKEDENSLVYQLDDKNIIFYMNEENTVESIILSIVTNEQAEQP